LNADFHIYISISPEIKPLILNVFILKILKIEFSHVCSYTQKEMASLTSVSVSARKFIRYGIYAFILLFILRFAFNIGTDLYKRFFPPRTPEATVAFGKLPKLTLPNPDQHMAENVSYTLELAEGSLPKLTEQAVVYKMPPFVSDIEVTDNAKRTAQQLGFRPGGKVLIESIPNVYVFEKSNAPSTLTMNIISGEFSISYNTNQNPAVLRENAGTADSAIQSIRSLLDGANLLKPDLANGPSTHEFLKYELGKYVPAISQSEANLIKVNLFREAMAHKIKTFQA
jgi:hypothetical protein